jgi:hypothetical protein
MRLATAAGQTWLLQNGALAAWNAYVQLLQKQRYAELAEVLLPLLRQLLKVRTAEQATAAGCGWWGQHLCCMCRRDEC